MNQRRCPASVRPAGTGSNRPSTRSRTSERWPALGTLATRVAAGAASALGPAASDSAGSSSLLEDVGEEKRVEHLAVAREVFEDPAAGPPRSRGPAVRARPRGRPAVLLDPRHPQSLRPAPSAAEEPPEPHPTSSSRRTPGGTCRVSSGRSPREASSKRTARKSGIALPPLERSEQPLEEVGDGLPQAGREVGGAKADRAAGAPRRPGPESSAGLAAWHGRLQLAKSVRPGPGSRRRPRNENPPPLGNREEGHGPRAARPRPSRRPRHRRRREPTARARLRRRPIPRRPGIAPRPAQAREGAARSPEDRAPRETRARSSSAGGGTPGRHLLHGILVGDAPDVSRPHEPDDVVRRDDREAGPQDAQVVEVQGLLVAEKRVEAELPLRDRQLGQQRGARGSAAAPSAAPTARRACPRRRPARRPRGRRPTRRWNASDGIVRLEREVDGDRLSRARTRRADSPEPSCTTTSVKRAGCRPLVGAARPRPAAPSPERAAAPSPAGTPRRPARPKARLPRGRDLPFFSQIACVAEQRDVVERVRAEEQRARRASGTP